MLARTATQITVLGLVLLALAPVAAQVPSQAPAGRLPAGLQSACGDVLCPKPSDPLARDGPVLRLLNLSSLGAGPLPSGGYGESMGLGELQAQLARQREHQRNDPVALLNAASAEMFAGRFPAAQPLLARALNRSVALQDAQAEGSSLNNLGALAALLGRYDEAATLLQRARQVFDQQVQAPRLPPTQDKAPPMPRLPGLPAIRMSPTQLERWRGEMRTQATQAASRSRLAVEWNLASLAAQLGQFADAEQVLARAVALASAEDDRSLRRTALAESELFNRRVGRLDKAAEFRRLALAIDAERNRNDKRRSAEDEEEDEDDARRAALHGPTVEVAWAAPPAARPAQALAPVVPQAAHPPSLSAAPPAAVATTAPPPPAQAPSRSAGGTAVDRLLGRLERLVADAAQKQMEQHMPSQAACGRGSCAPPEDAATRAHLLLRLAGTVQMPDFAALGQRQAGAGDPALRNATGIRRALAGQGDAAQADFAAALAASADGRQPLVEAAALQNLGAIAAAQGRGDEARARLQAAFAAYERLVAEARQRERAAGKPGQHAGLPDLGDPQAVLAGLGDGSASAGRLLVALNLANLQAQQGRPADSDAWAQRALDQSLRDGHGTQLVLHEMAVLARLRGQAQRAADLLQRARSGSENDELWDQVALGHLKLGAAAAPPAFGPAARPVAPVASPAAPAPVEGRAVARAASAASERAPSDPEPWQHLRTPGQAQELHATLAAEAAARERAGDSAGAITAHGRAALMAAAVGNGERERAALADLQRLHAAAGARDAAIFSGKRLVDATQDLRKGLEQLDRAGRQAFLASRRQAYVELVRVLLARDRLPEAEQVLRLLKEDEGQQSLYLPRSRGAVSFSLAEQAALQTRQALAGRIRPLQARLDALTAALSPDGRLNGRGPIEVVRLRNLGRTDQTLAMMESTWPAEAAAMAATCRSGAARAPAARTAADAEQQTECRLALHTMASTLGAIGDDLRHLQQDSPRFLEPPTAVQRRQIDNLLARWAALRSRLEPTLSAAGGAPATADKAGHAAAANLGGELADLLLQSGHLHQAWSLQSQIDALVAQADDLERGLEAALAAQAAPGAPAFAAAERQALDTGLRLMRTLPAGTVAVYYLGGSQRLDMLVVSATGWTHAHSVVTQTELDQRIALFRRALAEIRDPLPQARALHRLLIAPLQPVLDAAHARTLMLALDGPLRQLPFAALHDGSAWLTERYATSLYTTAAPTALAAVPAAQWRAAAFGSALGGAGMSPLPAVPAELDAIVRDPARRNAGLLPGEIRLNADFTAQALRDALRRRPNLVHIASHFDLKRGDADAAALLLGDGSLLRLADLSSADYRFDAVDLVTLSACDTALVAGNRFGQEVEAIGTLLQAQGAAAVMATLWPVADASTARFMRDFYAAREGQAGAQAVERVSKARALQLAQLQLIQPRAAPASDSEASGQLAAAAGADKAGADPSRGAAVAGRTAAAQELAPTYAHPFFWAPFVLMGNWR